jgi:hypothetical protein
MSSVVDGCGCVDGCESSVDVSCGCCESIGDRLLSMMRH